MSFLKTVPEHEATGDVAAMYDADLSGHGYVRNYTKAFSLRPAAFAAWGQLGAAVAQGPGADVRRYELATFSAALQLRSSYCALAHGQVITRNFLPADAVRSLAQDPASAPVSEADRAIVDFAGKVVDDATSINEQDVQRLRDVGLDDGQILDVILAAAARCFFSKVLDATGTLPDAAFRDLDPPELRDALTVGRSIEGC